MGLSKAREKGKVFMGWGVWGGGDIPRRRGAGGTRKGKNQYIEKDGTGER